VSEEVQKSSAFLDRDIFHRAKVTGAASILISSVILFTEGVIVFESFTAVRHAPANDNKCCCKRSLQLTVRKNKSGILCISPLQRQYIAGERGKEKERPNIKSIQPTRYRAPDHRVRHPSKDSTPYALIPQKKASSGLNLIPPKMLDIS
jgi:hypothetical protein